MRRDIDQKLDRFEKAIPHPPCSHEKILVSPTDEETAEADRQLAACPRCSTSKSSRPHMVVIIHEKPPDETLEPNILVIGSA